MLQDEVCVVPVAARTGTTKMNHESKLCDKQRQSRLLEHQVQRYESPISVGGDGGWGDDARGTPFIFPSVTQRRDRCAPRPGGSGAAATC